ncbi:hypothetical protein [Burkholderia sp. 572]|uniref:hypothetical protein n=1 Tax=Burkholderia sp. 572 TaxID=3156414 RepID=UPI00339098CE
MNAKQRALASMSDVSKIRGERARTALTRNLEVLRATIAEITITQRQIDDLSAAKRAWVIEGCGKAANLEVRLEEIRARIERFDMLIAAATERRTVLEDEVSMLEERCGVQRRSMLKHEELDKIFRNENSKIGRLRERADEEENADDLFSGLGRRGKR